MITPFVGNPTDYTRIPLRLYLKTVRRLHRKADGFHVLAAIALPL